MEVLLNVEGKIEDIASEEVKEIEEDEEEKAPTDEQVGCLPHPVIRVSH